MTPQKPVTELDTGSAFISWMLLRVEARDEEDDDEDEADGEDLLCFLVGDFFTLFVLLDFAKISAVVLPFTLTGSGASLKFVKL